MRKATLFAVLFVLALAALLAQAPAQPAVPVFSEPGPTNTRQTDPRMRKWLVEQIAREKPAAVIMNGDVPLAGNVANEYTAFLNETKVWRDQHLLNLALTNLGLDKPGRLI